jgi:hypothetical protein
MCREPVILSVKFLLWLKFRTAIKALFFYFNVCLSEMLESLQFFYFNVCLSEMLESLQFIYFNVCLSEMLESLHFFYIRIISY